MSHLPAALPSASVLKYGGAAGHLGQRAAGRRQGRQGVHPRLRHDARADLALPAEQRRDRALPPDDQGDCGRVQTPLSLEDAPRVVARDVEHDDTVPLHGALGYVTPQAKREGRDEEILPGGTAS